MPDQQDPPKEVKDRVGISETTQVDKGSSKILKTTSQTSGEKPKPSEKFQAEYQAYLDQHKAKLVTCQYCGKEFGAGYNEEITHCYECRDVHMVEQWKQRATDRVLLLQMGVPESMVKASFDDFRDKFKFIPAVHAPGMLICGTPSIGKTHLAVAVLKRELPNYATKDGYNVAFRSTGMLLVEIRDTFNKRGEHKTEADFIKKYINYDFLILDDLGSERPTEWALSILFDIINERTFNNKPTLITSNLTIAQLDQVDSRIAHRLSSYTRIRMSGEDKRIKQGRDIIFDTMGDETEGLDP